MSRKLRLKDLPADVRAQAIQADNEVRDTAFMIGLIHARIDEPMREFALVPDRKYRWDFAWPLFKLVLEVQGGVYNAGAHARAGGIRRDMEKLNLASIAGYRTIQLTPGQISVSRAGTLCEATLTTIRQALYGP